MDVERKVRVWTFWTPFLLQVHSLDVRSVTFYSFFLVSEQFLFETSSKDTRYLDTVVCVFSQALRFFYKDVSVLCAYPDADFPATCSLVLDVVWEEGRCGSAFFT